MRNPEQPPLRASFDRRELLGRAAGGVAGAALLALLSRAAFALAPAARREDAASDPLAPRRPHFEARAKHVIFLFMTGGPAQMDLFDYKPVLNARDGKTADFERRRGDTRALTILGSKRRFAQHGQTGQWCSDAFRHLPAHMDKLAVVKSLYTDSFAHGSALLQMNSGQTFQGHPSMGAWITYGLGSENGDLPGFVVMHDPRGGPISGPGNWASGYMPAAYQGTLLRSSGDPLLDLSPSPAAVRAGMTRAMEKEQIELIAELDRLHEARRPNASELAARARTYGLADRMRESAPAALDVMREDRATLELYGMFDPKPDHALSVGPAPFARQCIMARRLVERGVRFVQIYHGGGHQQQTWDAHHGVEENLAIHCPEVDRPIAGLLTDLERTGLLDETLVVWGGEFGRQPVVQVAGNGQVASSNGRDHNPKAFTMWFAGAGIRPGSYGETDELGGEAVQDRHHVRDLHATLLFLLGLDHEALTYYYGGLDRKLVGVIEPRLIKGILA